MILFIKMSFFHYNIAKAFFAIKFVRHRIWKEWKKYSITNDFEAFIYCDKGIYKSIKIFGWNSERSSMLHPKSTWRIFDKEKSNIFSNDFANGKIDTIMGLATLSLRMRKGCFSKNIAFLFLSIFLTSTAFVSTNAKYGIPLSRYTVFLQNCPLEWRSKLAAFFCVYQRDSR